MMDSQETIENDKLAAAFQDLLIQELLARGVHFTKATAENFSNVNIDVHIYIEDYWMMFLFKYIGIGWLRRRTLSEMTLEDYVKGYVDRELKELRQDIEYEIKDCSARLERKSSMFDHNIQSTIERLENAHKIASWLLVN